MSNNEPQLLLRLILETAYHIAVLLEPCSNFLLLQEQHPTHSSFYVDLTRKTIDQNLYISKQIGTYELPLELNGTTTIRDNMDVSSFQKYSDTNNAATTST